MPAVRAITLTVWFLAGLLRRPLLDIRSVLVPTGLEQRANQTAAFTNIVSVGHFPGSDRVGDEFSSQSAGAVLVLR